MFVGVVFGVSTQVLTGDIVVELAQTALMAAHTGVPTNLGACIKSVMVLDFEPLLLKRGYKAAPGYKIRSTLSV
jgi:hypothetical protein